MDDSVTRTYFFVVLTMILFTTIHSQTTSQQHHTITAPSRYFGNNETIRRIRWTWQLPALIKKAFNESQYKDWFIERMNVYDSSGKTFYRFFLNSGNLLDGDHYDSFLGKTHLDISDSGVIIRN